MHGKQREIAKARASGPMYRKKQREVESFNGKLRDEFLNLERLYTLKEAQVLIEQWRKHYNTKRPHSSLGYRPPAPEVKSLLEGLPAVAGLS